MMIIIPTAGTTIIMTVSDDNVGAHKKNDGTEWYVDKTKQVKQSVL